MAKIVECIPNFSEGRNQAVIDGLAATAKVFQVLRCWTTRLMPATTVASLHSLGMKKAFKKWLSNW